MTTSQQADSPAEAYQAYYGPAIFEPLSERVLAIAAPSAGETVIEVASGTGILTRKLAAAVGPAGRVLGVDVNPAMIEVAERLGGGASIEYRQGDGTALALTDGGFDAVYCQQGLQFYPDRAAGVREMRRVLDPGGRAVVVTWHGLDAHPLFAALADAEEPHLAAAGVDVDRNQLVAPFSFGDDQELAELLRAAGFSEVQLHQVSIDARFRDADHFVERMEFAYAAVIPQFAEDPAAFARYLEAINDETHEIVASYRRGDEVVVPMHANLALAHTG
jgi:ubiquinone/menaquinone biosynthesis C-methylase UbiE